ncbi:type I-E CRISPR-associated protein Cse2/CasB [Streptomyces sp. NPDC000927]|uniref:type I-E CRISPR-associated protein Cse2/CasB n=1 Tax=Streptomyces sp. NPDC000927 TaxID=3154371 RepID=UPI00332F1C98
MSTEAGDHVSDRFMATVRRACATSQGRAELSQGLNIVIQSLEHPESDAEASRWNMYSHLVPNGGIPGKTTKGELPYLLIAALYARHDAPNPKMPPKGNGDGPHYETWQSLGWSYNQAVSRRAMTSKAAEAALSRICGLDQNLMMQELPHCISELRSHGVPVVWECLLRDILLWPNYADTVRRNWAKGFHYFNKKENAS